MKKIISLTTVLVKEFYQNLPVFANKKKKVNKKKSIFFWILVIVFFGIGYLSNEIITFLKEIGQEAIFLNLYFFILAILLLFQAILICANIFFFSKDTEKILPLPIKTEELLLARFNTLLCMLYFAEGVFGLVPLTIYGLSTSANLLFYLWEIIVLLAFPIILAAIVSILILLIMRFARFIHNKEAFQFVSTIIMIILLCIIESQMMNGLFNTSEEQQIIQEINAFTEKSNQVRTILFSSKSKYSNTIKSN